MHTLVVFSMALNLHAYNFVSQETSVEKYLKFETFYTKNMILMKVFKLGWWLKINLMKSL